MASLGGELPSHYANVSSLSKYCQMQELSNVQLSFVSHIEQASLYRWRLLQDGIPHWVMVVNGVTVPADTKHDIRVKTVAVESNEDNKGPYMSSCFRVQAGPPSGLSGAASTNV